MRVVLFIIIAVIAGIIALAKMAFGKVTGNERLQNSNARDEAQHLIKKTAKGVSWMEKQWEEARREGDENESRERLPGRKD